jgi:ABC-type lipoprotein release transport system permease subunit
VTGSDNAFLRARNWTLVAGCTFSDSESRTGRALCLIGGRLRREPFGAFMLLANALKVPFILDLCFISRAFVFATGISILFGWFPARRAARHDPIHAPQHE